MTATTSERVAPATLGAALLLPPFGSTEAVRFDGARPTESSAQGAMVESIACRRRLSREERLRKIDELWGKYREMLPSSDEFNRMKHRDW